MHLLALPEPEHLSSSPQMLMLLVWGDALGLGMHLWTQAWDSSDTSQPSLSSLYVITRPGIILTVPQFSSRRWQAEGLFGNHNHMKQIPQ